MKTTIKIFLTVFGLIASVAWILQTPKVFEYANNHRWRTGIGSEIFYPFVPIVIIIIVIYIYKTKGTKNKYE